MYEVKDTIAAVSSPSGKKRAIIRIDGPEAIDVLNLIFSCSSKIGKPGIYQGFLTIDDELKVGARVYLFISPASYTGENLAEIHVYTSGAVTETLMQKVISSEKVRTAGPGEFTARAYMNGKIDLAQAEAVGQIVSSANRLQLTAAEKLLEGKLAKTTAKIRQGIINCMGLIEAGLDFSGHDIEFISNDQAIEMLKGVHKSLQDLLAGSISYEALIDLPSVTIAGAPNAGKSTLLNELLGQSRSIISSTPKTTRDVLSGILELKNNRCAIFDCAGLLDEPEGIIDQLAQQAAIQALSNCHAAIFCVDLSSDEFSADEAIFKLIETKNVIAAATKTDLLSKEIMLDRIRKLNELFALNFLPVSSKTGENIAELKLAIDGELSKILAPAKNADQLQSQVTLTARHKTVVTEAMNNIEEAIAELRNLQNEIAAMLMRNAFTLLGSIEQEHVDEQILQSIFSKFCIGK